MPLTTRGSSKAKNTPNIVEIPMDDSTKIKVAKFIILDDILSSSSNPIDAYLERFDEHDVADMLDGTGKWGRRPVPHSERFWEKEARYLSSRDFMCEFRCRKRTFAKLVKALYGTTEMCRVNDRGPIFDPCERVGIFLYRVGKAAGVRTTALRFNMSVGTVMKTTMDVANLVVSRLLPQFVRWPFPQEQRRISSAWEQEKGLREISTTPSDTSLSLDHCTCWNVIGSIDGRHIRIPGQKEELLLACFNYKHFYYIILLAIVDNRGLLRWFSSGTPGSCEDTGVFRSTKFFRQAEADQRKPVEDRVIFADGACILGDSAFAEGPWLRTPITLPTGRSERFYNYKHSSMRFRIEHAFGRLKWKFQALKNGLLFRLDNAKIIIDACCVLYNFMLIHEGESSSQNHRDDGATRNSSGRAHNNPGPAANRSAREAEVEHITQAGFLQEEWGQEGYNADRARQEDERHFRRVVDGVNETDSD